MSVSAEMYIVISLMFAVFAGVAAIGTSVVLGVGFERLRAGFEIVKKQTGFFADAIHQLDERTNMLEDETQEIRKAVSNVIGRVDSVEKQTGFFFESLNTLEEKILKGQPASIEATEETKVVAIAEPAKKKIQKKAVKKRSMPRLPNAMEWTATAETRELLRANQDDAPEIQKEENSHSLTSSFVSYLFSDNRASSEKGVVYH